MSTDNNKSTRKIICNGHISEYSAVKFRKNYVNNATNIRNNKNTRRRLFSNIIIKRIAAVALLVTDN